MATRLAFYDAGIDRQKIDAANAGATRIQNALWAMTVAAMAADPRSVAGGLFVNALNDVIDHQEKRQAAFDNHVPEPVLALLLVFGFVAFGFTGYVCGLVRRRCALSNALFALLVVLVLTTTLDLDRPRRGLIEVSQESLLRLQTSLAHDAK